MAASKVSMKLYIHSKTKSVLYAEAGKDCVDLLLGIMSLPMAAVTWLLREHGMVGCLSNMFKSFENLNSGYLSSAHSKGVMLTMMGTTCSGGGSTVPPIFAAGPDGKRSVYSCQNCRKVYRMDQQQPLCPWCGAKLAIAYGGDGYVKGTVTYMVMDDLEIKPLTTNSCFTLLNNNNVKEVGALEEKVVHISTDQALKLLKTSLHSKKVLTDVFMTDN